MSTCTVKLIDVLFKEPPSLKKRRERENVKEALVLNEERPRGPIKCCRRRRKM